MLCNAWCCPLSKFYLFCTFIQFSSCLQRLLNTLHSFVIKLFPVAAGQVMRRLNLTWFGNEGSIAQTASTFRICLYITIVYNVLDQLLKYYPLHVALLDWYTEDKLSQIMVTFGLLRSFLELSFYIFLVCVVAKTRAYVRNKYSIPEKSCHGCEDCCCAVWCPCLTVSQMARHTADYTTYAGTCCSQTGLPSHVPGIV